jgi:hypothetical protein
MRTGNKGFGRKQPMHVLNSIMNEADAFYIIL